MMFGKDGGTVFRFLSTSGFKEEKWRKESEGVKEGRFLFFRGCSRGKNHLRLFCPTT